MQLKPFAIGVFTRDVGGYYYGAMLRGIHHVTRAAGIPLLITQSALKDTCLPAFGAEYVAGWIVLHPMEDDRAHLAALLASSAPVVTVATAPDDLACTSVVADNRGATRALVNHLIDHGHHRIAYIDHGPDSWSHERYQGYLDALQERAIALDPTLIINTTYVDVDINAPYELQLDRSGKMTARQLIAGGMPCTALVAGTDQTAIVAMRALQAAGYRVPDDIAVVGFDDTAEAQYAQPPLTTARTRFDQFGRIAAEHLLAVLRGERDPRPTRIMAPSILLHRRSCGCAGVEQSQSQGAVAVAAANNWQSALAEQLAVLISYPLTPAPGTPPDQIWPGASRLIAAIDAVLQGQESAGFVADIGVAWQQAVALTDNLELLNATVALLEDATQQHLAAAPAAGPAVTMLFREFRMAILRARVGYEAVKYQHLTQASRTNQDVSLRLLSSQVGESQTLAWLHKTPASWGCLGQWDDASPASPAILTVAGLYQPDSPPMLAIGDRYSATAFPPVDALPVLARQGQDLTILLLMRVGTEDLGVLALCGFADHNFSFDTESLWVQAGLMAATLKRDAQARQLAQARDAAEAANAALAEARDAAEAANRAKSAFLAQMSHELRTPLNGVLGYADILMRKRLDDDTTNGLMIIKQSGEHLLTLINDILDLSKIEAGRLALSPTPLQLPVFLDGIVGIIRARAEAKQLHLHVAVSPDLPLWVTADETRLRQVLLNLLGNAVKFTEQGSVTLRVSSVGETQYLASLPVLSSELTCATGETQNLCRLRFEVSDTGPGIAPEQLEAIFQPFEQVGELRRRAEGTGLGLAISRQLVRAMGGEVHVESALGQGSTFWFALALPVADAVLPAAAEPERMITGYTGRRRTLLVVDDIASNRQVLAAMLEPLGFRVLLAEDGLQAVTLAQQQPDLILMDRWMPVLSGLEAARQIRQLPDMPRIPIVATSASVSEADQTVIRAAGYDDFLPKPIAWPRLVALLAQHLQLEWVYATDSEAARDGGVTATPGVLEPPPADELAALFELVQIGDIRAVQARAAQLQQSDVRWRPFMHRVVQLAGQFDLEQILALLAQYLPEDRQA